MSTVGSHRLRLILIIAAASLVLGVGSTAVLAAAVGGPRPAAGGPVFNAPAGSWPGACTTPALTGTVVDVTLTDMGAMMGPGMMGPGMMGPGWNGGMGMMGPGWNGRYAPGAPADGSWPSGYPGPGMGMMRIVLSPATVPAGPVSFRVRNTGMMIHEMTVLPLASGRSPGQLAIGADGKVDESAAVGHVARTCGEGEGEGDGILPGGIGWTTVTLQPGRYEVLCNIVNMMSHYGMGMYTQLDVVANR